MSEEEIKEYLKRFDELELKLTDEDKDTYQWLLFGYNKCARLLNEKEQENKQLKDKLEFYSGLELDKTIDKTRLEYNKLQKENQQLIEKINGVYEERTYLYNKLSTENEQLNILVNSCQEEIRQLKKQLEYLRSREYYNQLRFERDMLQYVVDNGKVSKEDKEFIDMTHRNTELLEVIEEVREYTKSHFKEMVADEEAQGLLQILDKAMENKQNS